MDEIIEYLEKKIQSCDELGGMQLEKFAFVVTLKKARKIAMNYTRCCKSDSELLTSFAEYLKERDILTTKKENIPVRVDLFLKRG